MESQTQVLTLAWQTDLPTEQSTSPWLITMKNHYFKKNESWPKDKTISKWQSQNLTLKLSDSRALQPQPTVVLHKSPIFIPGTLSSKEESLWHGRVLFHETNYYDQELSQLKTSPPALAVVLWYSGANHQTLRSVWTNALYSGAAQTQKQSDQGISHEKRGLSSHSRHFS